MSPSASTSAAPEALRRWGEGALWGGLVLGLGGTLALAWVQPTLLPLVPVVLLAGMALATLVHYPLLHLCIVLGGFVIIFDYDEGIQASEVLFGLYYLGYLGAWLVYHVLFRGEQLLRHPLDYAIALYLLFTTASLVLTPFFGGSLFQGLNAWRAVIVFAFYFPIRNTVRDSHALWALLLTFVFIALFVAFRNFLQYFLALRDVGALWEIVQNRHRTNERLVMMGLLGALTFLLYYARRWSIYLPLLGLAAVFTASIMLGRSRTIWLTIGLALVVIFALVNRRDRLRLLLFGASGFAIVLVLGFILLSDLFVLVLTGLGDRFATIGTASETDISMINRFHEWRTVWSHIQESPIVGHGFGVPYHFYNIIYHISEHKLFVHNTYLGILYRSGVVGLGLVLVILGGSFMRGIRIVRQRRGRLAHSTALTATASLAALALAATTEDVIFMTDGIFAVMFPAALLAGLGERAPEGIETR